MTPRPPKVTDLAGRKRPETTTLSRRCSTDSTAPKQDLALQELRAVMSDSDAHRDYGIDTTQI